MTTHETPTNPNRPAREPALERDAASTTTGSPRTCDDTVAAIATATGAAGLAVVRLSGRDALACADRVFAGAGALGSAAGHTLHHGWAVDENGARVDEVVAAVFRAPRSYTREDVIELSCHGGHVSAARVLAALCHAGARLAAPGEFTLRAFLNGRLDLAQAEAVADLIHADTLGAHALALSQLRGGLSQRLDAVSEAVSDVTAEVEARVDFAEDVGGVEVPPHVVEAIVRAHAALGAMLSGSAWARAVREGVRVPLVGRPNVGKSSLFNALLGEARAIVTAHAGTTRDLVSESLEIAGVRVTLADSAGLREALEPIEAIGIARTHEALESSAVALWVLDGSQPLAAEDRAIATRLRDKRVLVALNKCDLPCRTSPADIAPLLAGVPHRIVAVSAVRGDGIEALNDALAGLLGAQGDLSAAVGNARHVEALRRAQAALERASAVAREGAPGEIVALELREGLFAIGEVTGRGVSDDLLDRIFSRFCIGK